MFSDYVYFETSSTSPYQIRRIEELNKVLPIFIHFEYLLIKSLDKKSFLKTFVKR